MQSFCREAGKILMSNRRIILFVRARAMRPLRQWMSFDNDSAALAQSIMTKIQDLHENNFRSVILNDFGLFLLSFLYKYIFYTLKSDAAQKLLVQRDEDCLVENLTNGLQLHPHATLPS